VNKWSISSSINRLNFD